MMKSNFTLKFSPIFFSLILLFVFCIDLFGQTPRQMLPKDCAVPVIAKSQNNPPAIILTWKKNDITLSYEIRRKMKDEQSWSDPIAYLDNSVTSYTDLNVQIGQGYEYMITAIDTATVTLDLGLGGNPTYSTTVYGFGYVYAGVNLVPSQNQGRLLLIVDETLLDALPSEIETLKSDLTSEGWTVVEKLVPRAEKFNSAAVQNVKSIIKSEYQKDTKNTNTVFILGRVAVPYSGDINKNQGGGVVNATDAHPNHCGAWPADVYYGHLVDGDWTDTSVNDTIGSRKENWNKPGDGKFDLTQLQNDVKLCVGRVDFYDMPAFKKSEVELIKNYLKRDHEYRTGQISITLRGLVDDNFAWLGAENPGQNGWRNFPPMVGLDSVFARDWFTELSKSSYLWAYGCGGGSYNSCGGIGTTTDFTKNSMNAIFTMMFGSYFGDWDSQDNILRAQLCSDPPALATVWAGRPSWFFHHMASGVPIGFSNKISQNNYPKNQNYLYPANRYIIQQDPYKGYWLTNQVAPGYVHMALMGDPTLTMYMGVVPQVKNISVYQQEGEKVRISWQKPEQQVDGYNVFFASDKNGPFEIVNDALITDTVYIDPTKRNGQVYYMVRAVKLQLTNSGSFDNSSQGIIKGAVTTDVSESIVKNYNLIVAPNPATTNVNISLSIPSANDIRIEVYDINGNLINKVISAELASGTHEFVWNLTDRNGIRVVPGVYLIKVQSAGMTDMQKVVVMP